MRIPYWWRRRRPVPTEGGSARRQAEADLAFTRAQTPVFEAIAEAAGDMAAPLPMTHERGSMNGGA